MEGLQRRLNDEEAEKKRVGEELEVKNNKVECMMEEQKKTQQQLEEKENEKKELMGLLYRLVGNREVPDKLKMMEAELTAQQQRLAGFSSEHGSTVEQLNVGKSWIQIDKFRRSWSYWNPS